MDKFAVFTVRVEVFDNEIGDVIFAGAHIPVETHHERLFGRIKILDMSSKCWNQCGIDNVLTEQFLV